MSPRVSRDDVAKVAGVSPSTVSRALNDSPLLPLATRQRVQSVAAELGYQINAAARRLAARRSFQLGFVMPHSVGRGALQLGYYAEALNAAVIAADEHGYEISLLLHREGDAPMFERLRTLHAQQRVDGLILSGLSHDSRLPGQLAKTKLPFVLLGSHKGQHPCVDYDPRPGLSALVARLSERRVSRVCYVAGSSAYSNARDQQAAFADLLGTAGIDLGPVLVGNYSLRQTEQVLLAHPEALACDAICCANDRSAIGAYNVMRQHGRTIGSDMLISGFDDDEHGRLLQPTLTTIHQPRQAAGTQAVKLLIDLLEEGGAQQQFFIPTSFVQRDSL